ncbi:expressed unknown protein [Seminavis robusta]|uniref:Uncharacterized protein n=1 Tax=Seminavis robusta TaxID=568900 RepID=A0A9N8HL89_9STRA|nr:expressed unknown protein [Seminavis robusta]|eukprot:Sro792_g203090.1 n/a (230) ;mRNA; r:20375-21171
MAFLFVDNSIRSAAYTSNVGGNEDFTIKVVLGSKADGDLETRRFQLRHLIHPKLGTASLENLGTLLKEATNSPPQYPFYYRDDDGEVIAVSTTRELQDAISQSLNKARLYLYEEKPATGSEDKPVAVGVVPDKVVTSKEVVPHNGKDDNHRTGHEAAMKLVYAEDMTKLSTNILDVATENPAAEQATHNNSNSLDTFKESKPFFHWQGAETEWRNVDPFLGPSSLIFRR